HLVVGATARPRRRDGWPSLPSHAVWALDVVTAPTEVRPAVEQVLERVAIVPDTPDALALLAESGDLTVVTGDGDVYGPGFVRGGSSAAPSLLELQAAVDETRAVLEDATRRSEE